MTLASATTLALLSADLYTIIAMIVLLVGMPLFVVAVLAVFSAYIQYDAEQYLEELEAEGGRPDGEDRD